MVLQGVAAELRVVYNRELMESFMVPTEWTHTQSDADILGKLLRLPHIYLDRPLQ